MSDLRKLPELLCPAGSMDALDAAIEGGADAIYLGGSAMNARLHAGNFSPEELRVAVRKAHAYGVKIYLTLNTLVTDKELPVFLEAALDASRAGVDALITADIGGAAAIRRAIPGMELHASTQMSGHSSAMGAELKKLGFSRMVAARELSASDLRLLIRNSPLETEVFVHGALCVSCSGQCLFSSVVGGRSGNRGECAQPCRLPYTCTGSKNARKNPYPLSLKDLSLAAHVPELIELGISSLKIEGRMKSPEYVRDTARIWRKLLDERRAATPGELQRMAESFSRGGFTDGYFTGHIGHSMLGVRSEADKQNSRASEPFSGITRKRGISLSAYIHMGEPSRLTLSDGTHRITVTGAEPQPARTAPMTEDSVLRSLCRLGGTPYEPAETEIDLTPGTMLPVSQLNDLRRRAIEALTDACALPPREEHTIQPQTPSGSRQAIRTARFALAEQITEEALAFFDRVSLPLHRFAAPATGVILPPVIPDGEVNRIREQLQAAVIAGARFATVGNLGHLALVKEAGLIALGDFRLNITNRESVALYESLGFAELLLSPELSLPQMRDLGGNTSAIVYGRLPLMTLEKCVIRELADCSSCRTDSVRITDRRGISFPVLREWDHRNVIYNSLPTAMPDRPDKLAQARLLNQHFLFTTESPSEVNEVIRAYQTAIALPFQVRRM